MEKYTEEISSKIQKKINIFIGKCRHVQGDIVEITQKQQKIPQKFQRICRKIKKGVT